MITIKSDTEIEIMKESGQIIASLHEILREAIRPGITTIELDRIAESYIIKCGAVPSFKGYRGHSGAIDYPATICTSINNQVVHGIPDNIVLNEGDIISIDVGACYKGFHSDAARTWGVGKISPIAQKLIDVTKQSFYEGIKYAIPGNRIGDISARVQEYVEKNGFSVVRDYVGHGIGRNLHESPQIPNYKCKERGPRLQNGMTLAIEPMVNQGKYDVEVTDNKWTVVTVDGTLSAHYENTIAIIQDSCIILSAINS